MTTLEFGRLLAGGLLIGSGASLLLLLNGKIAGISGIFGNAIRGDGGEQHWRWGFLAGLIIPGLLRWGPAISVPASTTVLLAAGLLVGFGTSVGTGCTSGHGVCGIANLSLRSLLATCLFIGAAIVTVFVVRQL